MQSIAERIGQTLSESELIQLTTLCDKLRRDCPVDE
jgi:hypothetical protein